MLKFTTSMALLLLVANATMAVFTAVAITISQKETTTTSVSIAAQETRKPITTDTVNLTAAPNVETPTSGRAAPGRTLTPAATSAVLETPASVAATTPALEE